MRGERFAGRYEFVDRIGDGGMGTVWRAWDHRERAYVAAKMLRHVDAEALLRFVREQALRVAHPHVTAPSGWAAEDDRVLLRMDLIRGGSVEDLLADYGPLPLPHVAVLLGQLLDGLAAVHAHGIVHRDVKPANLLLEPTGRARPHLRLSDFGIALVHGEPRLTGSSAFLGTPGYIAPEVAGGADPDPRQDLFPVGVVAYELITGVRPTGWPSVRPGPRPTHIPAALWDLVRALLAADPEDRPASASEAADHLTAATTDIEAPDPTHPDAIEVFDHIAPLPEGYTESGPTSYDAVAPPRKVAPRRTAASHGSPSPPGPLPREPGSPAAEESGPPGAPAEPRRPGASAPGDPGPHRAAATPPGSPAAARAAEPAPPRAARPYGEPGPSNTAAAPPVPAAPDTVASPGAPASPEGPAASRGATPSPPASPPAAQSASPNLDPRSPRTEVPSSGSPGGHAAAPSPGRTAAPGLPRTGTPTSGPPTPGAVAAAGDTGPPRPGPSLPPGAVPSSGPAPVRRKRGVLVVGALVAVVGVGLVVAALSGAFGALGGSPGASPSPSDGAGSERVRVGSACGDVEGVTARATDGSLAVCRRGADGTLRWSRS